ncbi:MAG: domain containing protein [Deltaproteobacteria bacterium]|nr:domain containing protein [Deltaproteobacteria bacterium]
MTVKRDLKRRVRDRQQRTGESYTTARRHVLADRPNPSPSPSAIPVDEVIDVSELAAAIGLRCKVLVFPAVAERAEPTVVLTAVRDALIATTGDPATERLRRLALRGEVSRAPDRWSHDRNGPRFIERVRAGLGGMSDDGRTLAIHVAGRAGIVPILCTPWRRDPTLMLMTIDDWLRPRFELELLAQPGSPALGAGSALCVILNGQRYPITKEPFVIGRNPAADLVIDDRTIAVAHAAVLHRNGVFFLKDLGSPTGLTYRGMRIDNKRIDEGDVFHLATEQIDEADVLHLATYELRFTYTTTDT